MSPETGGCMLKTLKNTLSKPMCGLCRDACSLFCEHDVACLRSLTSPPAGSRTDHKIRHEGSVESNSLRDRLPSCIARFVRCRLLMWCTIYRLVVTKKKNAERASSVCFSSRKRTTFSAVGASQKNNISHMYSCTPRRCLWVWRQVQVTDAAK